MITSFHFPGQAVNTDLICFSHLRWDFVFQRPQHLMMRFKQHMRVFFIEESIDDATADAFLEIKHPADNLWVVVPHIPQQLEPVAAYACQQALLEQFFTEQQILHYVCWYYTPMSLYISEHLDPLLIVYDCMDELSAFKNAPAALTEKENVLLQCADIVFTGGHSLYEAKRHQHPNIHYFPSSVDKAHFAKARIDLPEPEDQQQIPHPRFGFFGVLDERLDITLLQALAAAQPAWHFVLIGPVVKIDPASLPQAPNIHYLGMKSYDALPAYISSWEIAVLLFALNESTRFISPTKTPEYLAAGKPVISTPIHDVIYTYGDKGLIHITDQVTEFIDIASQLLQQPPGAQWQAAVDDYLTQTSWDQTWENMAKLIQKAFARKSAKEELIKL